MSLQLNLSSEQPIIHIKAYSGIRIMGVEQPFVTCEVDAPQLATLVEENGHVYLTVNASSEISVPVAAQIELERAMGSVKISGVHGTINGEKALGNLVLNDVGEVRIGKVGGNFSVRKASGAVQIEKVGGNLVVDEVGSFRCEKIGGSCKAKNIQGDFLLEKAGGDFKGQTLNGLIRVEKVGGSFKAQGLTVSEDIRAGGDIVLKDFAASKDGLALRAGGSIRMEVGDNFEPTNFEMRSGGQDIRIMIGQDDLDLVEYTYVYKMPEASRTISAAAGGDVSLRELTELQDDFVGDLSDKFAYEESAFSELIQERVTQATRMAEAKVKAAEIRLDKIMEKVEKQRGFSINVDTGEVSERRVDISATPSVTRPAGKKGASDEERLMILKMLQDKKITVDEAETLFKALDD